MARTLNQALSESYERHRDAVWGMCYRMTGSAQDADELTQETFLRLGERPPEDLDESLCNWLLTVGANLCRDRLRERKKTSYVGQWLPQPVPFDETSNWFLREGEALELDSPEERLARLESASYAFLVALEELTPNQRSVLLLRDVYDLSVRETASALELSRSNVKTIHHRARKRLNGVELEAPETQLRESTRRVLDEFLECITTGDFTRLERLFRDDVRLVSDGGDGEYTAATRPVAGSEAVIAFIKGLSAKRRVAERSDLILNGLPAVALHVEDPSERIAPTLVIRLDVDDTERVRQMHFVLGTEKLGRIFDEP